MKVPFKMQDRWPNYKINNDLKKLWVRIYIVPTYRERANKINAMTNTKNVIIKRYYW